MVSRKIFTCFFIAIILICVGSFVIPIYTHALSLQVGAECDVSHPWWAFWTSELRAYAKASWTHSKWIGQIIIPHWHSGEVSLYARIADNEPDTLPVDMSQDSSVPFWVNSLDGAISRYVTCEDWGIPRWKGDAYASSTISENGNPTNWSYDSDGSEATSF